MKGAGCTVRFVGHRLQAYDGPVRKARVQMSPILRALTAALLLSLMACAPEIHNCWIDPVSTKNMPPVESLEAAVFVCRDLTSGMAIFEDGTEVSISSDLKNPLGLDPVRWTDSPARVDANELRHAMATLRTVSAESWGELLYSPVRCSGQLTSANGARVAVPLEVEGRDAPNAAAKELAVWLRSRMQARREAMRAKGARVP